MSSLICDSCSNELYGAYIFLLKIQKSEAEQQLKRITLCDVPVKSSIEVNRENNPKVVKGILSPRTELEKEGFLLIYDSKKTDPVEDIEAITELNQIEEVHQQEATKIDSDYDVEDTLEVLDVISEDSEDELPSSFEHTPEVEIIKPDQVCYLTKSTKRPGKMLEQILNKKICLIPSFIVIPKISYETNPELDSDPEKRVFYLSVKPTIVERQQNGFLIEDPSLMDSIEEPDVLFKCKFCIKAFSIASYLLIHVRKSHLCGSCLKCFKSYQDLNIHVKTAHTISTCPFCNDRTFTNAPSYRYHLKKSHQLVLPPFMSLVLMEDKEELCDLEC